MESAVKLQKSKTFGLVAPQNADDEYCASKSPKNNLGLDFHQSSMIGLMKLLSIGFHLPCLTSNWYPEFVGLQRLYDLDREWNHLFDPRKTFKKITSSCEKHSNPCGDILHFLAAPNQTNWKKQDPRGEMVSWGFWSFSRIFRYPFVFFCGTPRDDNADLDKAAKGVAGPLCCYNIPLGAFGISINLHSVVKSFKTWHGAQKFQTKSQKRLALGIMYSLKYESTWISLKTVYIERFPIWAMFSGDVIWPHYNLAGWMLANPRNPMAPRISGPHSFLRVDFTKTKWGWGDNTNDTHAHLYILYKIAPKKVSLI